MEGLTVKQKMLALSNAMYQGGVPWTPAPGDYYTSSRPDLELYLVVCVNETHISTMYTDGSDDVMHWPKAGFLTEGFGPNRIHVPKWILDSK